FYPANVVHVVGAGGLALGVLAACSASWWDAGDWFANHVLMFAWCTLGLVLLATGWLGAGRSPAGTALVLPSASVWAWVEAVGILVVALALRWTGEDPSRPYWSAAATLAVSLTAGALALWSRRSYHVYASGLLVCIAGSMVWAAWGPSTFVSFAYTNVL